MENTKVPYRIRVAWDKVISGACLIICAYLCIIYNITSTHTPDKDFWWFAIACGIVLILEGSRSYVLTNKGISCYMFGIPVKKFYWEQAFYIVFFPYAREGRYSIEATLLLVTENCPIYKKDRQEKTSFWWYKLTHWGRVLSIKLPMGKEQEIFEMVQELCEAPIEVRKRKN